MKVLFGAIATESNSFSSIPTSRRAFEDYGIFSGEEIYEREGIFQGLALTLRDVLASKGATAVPSIVAFAQPGAPTIQGVYEQLRDTLLRDVEAVRPDMVILFLHGAMLSQDCLDCEGDVLERVRALVGSNVPIGVVLDPHAHLTRRMLDNATLLSFMKEYPHTDMIDRLRDVVPVCFDVARGKCHPVWAVEECRMISFWPTQAEPMRGFVDRMLAQEGHDGILSISFVHGFPYGDTPDTGAKILVYADGDRDAAGRLAGNLRREIWDTREQTRIKPLSLDEAVERLRNEALIRPAVDLYPLTGRGEGPLVLADMADNPGGGAPGDSTFILRKCLDRGVRGVALHLYDPLSVQACFDAGIGARLELRIGGKTGPASGDPVDLSVQVMGLDADARQSGTGEDGAIKLGAAAWVQGNGIDLVLVSRREQFFNPDGFTRLGLNLSNLAGVVVKSTNLFVDGFGPVAREILYVDTAGALRPDMSKIPYKVFERSYWPRVENPW
jgi:microcystin degradation protein MlrC